MKKVRGTVLAPSFTYRDSGMRAWRFSFAVRIEKLSRLRHVLCEPFAQILRGRAKMISGPERGGVVKIHNNLLPYRRTRRHKRRGGFHACSGSTGVA